MCAYYYSMELSLNIVYMYMYKQLHLHTSCAVGVYISTTRAESQITRVHRSQSRDTRPPQKTAVSYEMLYNTSLSYWAEH